MVTLEETLAEQSNLEALCADRDLVTQEIFNPNAYYGMDSILKEYAGLLQKHPLKGVVPHGIYYDENYLWEAEKIAPVPAILCYSGFRNRIYAKETDKLVVPSASPFLYLLEILKDQPKPPRKGTIFFPAHSTHHITTRMDIERLADQVMQLDDHFQPVTVCVYWRDLHLGQHKAFEKRGLKLVSAGHMFDPLFLYRFYHLCSMHKYAASNEIGSNLFYAFKAGCSYFLIDEAITLVGDEEEKDLENRAKRPPELRALFRKPLDKISDDQKKAVDSYLGTQNLKSPEELNRQLRQLEWLDRFGFLVHNKGFPSRFVTPYYYRRKGMPFRKEYDWSRKKLGGLKRKIRYLVGRKAV